MLYTIYLSPTYVSTMKKSPNFWAKNEKKNKKKNWVRNQICICNVTPDDDHDGNDDEHDDDVAH